MVVLCMGRCVYVLKNVVCEHFLYVFCMIWIIVFCVLFVIRIDFFHCAAYCVCVCVLEVCLFVCVSRVFVCVRFGNSCFCVCFVFVGSY